MSKSSKKRRQKRKRDLEKLRGRSVLDEECSPINPLGSSPNPLSSQYLSTHSRLILPTEADEIDRSNKNSEGRAVSTSDSMLTQRKRIEFVLPRANGRAQPFIFDKPPREPKIILPVIPEGQPGGQSGIEPTSKKEETLEDILFPTKRRRLAEKFEAVHRAEETKKGNVGEGDMTVIVETKVDTPLAPLKTKQTKRRRSRSLDEDEAKKHSVIITGSDDTHPGKLTGIPSEMANRQLSGRSVEQAVEDKYGLRPRANSTDGELNLPQRGLCDEQMVLQSHQWQDKHTFTRLATPRGLNNVGNTCFLSSILQCLAYSPPFCQSLMAISDMKDSQAKNGMKPKQNHGQRITASLCSLFQRVHGFLGEHSNERSVSPQAIVQMLPKLGSIGSRNGYKFWPGRQEDAHEFLVHLLDAMHDGELRGAGIHQHLSGWRDRLPVTRLDETTFIHRIFGGYFRSQVRCKVCGYCSNTYDPFLDLSLEVSKKSSCSIMSALGEFTRKETLDSENQWKCSGCKKYVCPTKQLTVFRAPLCLCIQLKRFTFDSGFGGLGGGRSSFGSSGSFSGRSKITKPIEFPADLSLPLSDGRSCAYSLTGVVIHVGGNASSGHYTAYVKQPGKQGKSQWYHADDSFVEPVSEKTVLRQKDAYILFYCRKEVKLEFPSLPPRDMSTEEAKEFGRARARARADSSGAEDAGLTEERRGHPYSPQTPAIHPLAAFLNQSMSEQFKNGLSPSNKSIKGSEPLTPSFSPTSKVEVYTRVSKRGSSDSDSSVSEVETSKALTASRNVENSSSYSDSSDSDSQKGGGTIHPPTVTKRGNADDKERTLLSSQPSTSSASEGSSGSEKRSNKVLGLTVLPSMTTPTGQSSLAESPPAERSSDTETLLKSSDSSSIPPTEECKGGFPLAPSSSSESESSESEPEKVVATSESSAGKMPKGLGVSPLGDGSKTRVVVGNTDSRAKVTVMMGPRKKKAWVSKTFATTQKGSAFQLLGNLSVSNWDDEQESTPKSPTSPAKSGSRFGADTAREAIVQKMEMEEKSKKRKTHLDRWDSVLDLGRTKKVKKNASSTSTFVAENPKKNAFQRIQAGIQQMNKGKAKGLFRRKANDEKGLTKKKGRF